MTDCVRGQTAKTGSIQSRLAYRQLTWQGLENASIHVSLVLMVARGLHSGLRRAHEGEGWRGTGWLEDALLLLVHGGPVSHGFSSVDGGRVNLELDPLGFGGERLAEKHLFGP